MYVQDGGFQPPKVEGPLPHFLVLHRMMRMTLAPRISYSESIPSYERNLLDALMKPVRFDVFEYTVDEIWNIATNPLRSCGFAPYIQFMIESVALKKFYKDVRHDSLRPAVPKDPRASRAGSSAALTAAPSHTTRSGGAPSAPTTNSSILKMLWGIFALYQHTDQHLDKWISVFRLCGATRRLLTASGTSRSRSSPTSLSSRPSSTPTAR
jgi:hypothetical protein